MTSKWKEVFPEDRSSHPPAAQTCVLHVFREDKDAVWALVCMLTKDNQLGSRSTISPGECVVDGELKYSILLDVSGDRIDKVKKTLLDKDLKPYITRWKEINNAFGH